MYFSKDTDSIPPLNQPGSTGAGPRHSTNQPVIPLSLLAPLCSLRTTIKSRLITNHAATSAISSERRNHTSLTLNQKLEKIFSKEGMSKAKSDQNLGFLWQMVAQVVNAKGKFLRKFKVLLQWTNKWLKKNLKHLIADMGKVSVVWIDQTTHNISVSQSIVHSKALTPFNYMKAQRVRKKNLQKKS